MKKQKGFGIIEVIIIIAAVVLIAGIVWFALRPKQAEQTSSSSPTPTPSSTSTPSQSVQFESTLSITHWGVKFPYINKPAGLTYTIETDNGFERILFGSAELKKYADVRDSANWCSGGSLGLVYRSTSNTTQGDAASNFNGLVAHVGEYYYMYTHTQNPCSSNTEVQVEQGKQQSQLIELLKSLKQ